jgi:hypothetical protein
MLLICSVSYETLLSIKLRRRPSRCPGDAVTRVRRDLFDTHDEEMLGGNDTYTVRTEEPPVDAFWSPTVYDTGRGGFLHPNEDDRYHIKQHIRRPE